MVEPAGLMGRLAQHRAKLRRAPLGDAPARVAFAALVVRWRDTRDEAAQLLVLWFGVIVVFFTFISCKRTGYLVPTLPATGLAVGYYLSNRPAGGFRWPRLHLWLLRATFGLWALLAVVGGGGLFFLPDIVGRLSKFSHLRGAVADLMTPATLTLGVAGALILLALAARGWSLARRPPASVRPVL